VPAMFPAEEPAGEEFTLDIGAANHTDIVVRREPRTLAGGPVRDETPEPNDEPERIPLAPALPPTPNDPPRRKAGDIRVSSPKPEPTSPPPTKGFYLA